MKKLITLFLSFSSVVAFAQEKKLMFTPGAGAVMNFNSKSIEGVSGFDGGGYGLGIHLRYIVSGEENSTVTVGTHATIGYEAGSETTMDSYGQYVGTGDTYSMGIVDIPLIVDYNIGHNASFEASNRFGAYFGGGYGFNSSFGSGYSFTTHGPIVNLGVRYQLFGRSSGFHFSAMKSMNHAGVYLFGIGFLQNIKRSDSGGGMRSDSGSGTWEYIY